MNNSLTKIAKKALTGFVTTTTILWSVGVASLPLVAKAAIPTAPALVKGSLASVYYLGTDGKRYVFPNETTFFTWYKDFSGVVTITDSELASLPIGGNVTFREGSWMGKITTDPKTYWVSKGGVLQLVSSEADAIKLAGSQWAKQVRDIPDAFFVNYKIGAPLDSNNLVAEGMLFRTVDGGQVYLFNGGQAHKVTSAGMTANGFKDAYVRTRTDLSVSASALSLGADIVDNSYWLSNAPSGAGSSTSSPLPSAGTGSLSVSLASDTPAGVTLASGTSFNPVLKVSLASSGGDVKISGLKVTRGGLSTDSAISGVGVYDGAGKRHGNIITFANNVAQLTFAPGDEIVVSGSQSLWIKYNITAAAAGRTGTVSTSIAAATDITSNATSVSGSFPAAGGTFTLTDGTNSVGTVTLDTVQLYNNAATDATVNNINIGDVNKDLTKFRFVAGANEDIQISKMTLRNSGNALDADWGNAKLIAPDGTVLSTVANTMNQYLTFDLSASPYTILKGQTRDLTVRIDVPTGSRGSSRTVRLVSQNDYDTVVKGTATNSFLLPTANGAGNDTAFPIGDLMAGTAVFVNKLTIAAGTLTLSRSSSTPSGNISAGGSGVVLAQYDLTPNGEDMEIRQLTYTIASATNLTGTFRVDVNGTTIYSVAGATAIYNAATIVTPNTFYKLTSNVKASMKVYGDISSTAAAGTTYVVTIDVPSVRRVQTDDILDPQVNPSAGNSLTVQNASLAVAKSTSYNDTATVAGAQGVKMGSFTLSSGTTESVIVSSVTLGLNSVVGLSNLVLKSGTTQIGTAVANPTVANSMSFTLEVPGGNTVTLDAYADLQSTATGNYTSTLTVVTATGKLSSVAVTANPSTAVNGQTIAVSASGTMSLTLDTTTTPSGHVVHSSQVDEPLAAVRLSAGNSEDVKVTNVQIAVSNGTNNYYQFKLFDGSTQVGNAVDLVGNVANFGGLTYIVPRSTSKVLTLRATSTYSSIMNILGGNTHAYVSYIEGVGASSGTQIKPGTTLSTAWTATNITLAGASLTVASTDGFNLGDLVHVQDTATGDGTWGTVNLITDATHLSVGAAKAFASGGAGLISKVASGSTTTATAGTILKAGVAITVPSSVGFQAGDAVLAYNSTEGTFPGFVTAVGAGSITVRGAKTFNAGRYLTDPGTAMTLANAARIAKLGLGSLSTAWTATSATAAPLALTVASSSGFNVGDLVMLSDSTVGIAFGMVTAIASSTSLTIAASGALALTGAATGNIARIGSTQSALVTTAATVGTVAVAGNVANTVTTNIGFGVGDTAAVVDGTNGFTWGRVMAIANTASVTVAADVAGGAAATRVTRMDGASSSARLMINHNVEPTISLQATSPSGSLVGAAGQVVARLAVKADGDRDMTWTALRIVSNGSNTPQFNVSGNYELKRGSQSLSKVVSGVLSGFTTSAASGAYTAGNTLYICNATATGGGTDWTIPAGAGGTSAVAKAAAGLTKTGTKFTVTTAAAASRSTIFTITNTPAGTAAGACGAGNAGLGLILDQGYAANTAPFANGAAFVIELFDRYFDANQAQTGDTALQAQVVTAGNTDLLDILADTQNVRNGAGAGTSVSFNIQVPGVAGAGIAGQPGGLTWNYTDAAANASGAQTVSDSYPVNSNTLIY